MTQHMPKKKPVKNTEASKGFTLMEMLIVVAIIAILIAIAIPAILSNLDKTYRVQCLANRSIIERRMKIELMLELHTSETDTINAVLTDARDGGNIYFAGECICIKGGTYTYQDGRVVCSVADHMGEGGAGGGDTPGNGDAELLARDMSELIAAYNGDSAAFYKKFGMKPGTVMSNDIYRKILFEQVYGGSWPSLEQSFLDKNGIGTPLYIQSYVAPTAGGGAFNSDEVILFASGSNSAAGSWHTNMVYDKDNGVWYRSKTGYSSSYVHNNTWSNLKEELKDDSKWEALTP